MPSGGSIPEASAEHCIWISHICQASWSLSLAAGLGWPPPLPPPPLPPPPLLPPPLPAGVVELATQAEPFHWLPGWQVGISPSRAVSSSRSRAPHSAGGPSSDGVDDSHAPASPSSLRTSRLAVLRPPTPATPSASTPTPISAPAPVKNWNAPTWAAAITWVAPSQRPTSSLTSKRLRWAS